MFPPFLSSCICNIRICTLHLSLWKSRSTDEWAFTFTEFYRKNIEMRDDGGISILDLHYRMPTRKFSASVNSTNQLLYIDVLVVFCCFISVLCFFLFLWKIYKITIEKKIEYKYRKYKNWSRDATLGKWRHMQTMPTPLLSSRKAEEGSHFVSRFTR